MTKAEFWMREHSHACWRVARKVHVCGETHCSTVIAKGARYFDAGELIEPATFKTLRLCQQCALSECD